jgi:hypothetical protein
MSGDKCYLCPRSIHGGGVAAPVRKCREATEAAQTGWSLTTQVVECISRNMACERPPRPLLSMDASRYFLGVASTPPLQGGECATFSNSLTAEGLSPRNKFVHTSQIAPTIILLYFCSAALEVAGPIPTICRMTSPSFAPS